MPFGYVVLVAFWTVLVAELAADKSLYAVTSLTLRFRKGVVFTATTAVFAAKMLAVVLLAKIIGRLHSQWADLLSAAAFFLSALLIWFPEGEPIAGDPPANPGWWRAAVVCFLSLFLTEWGDPGQVAVAALAVRSHSLLGAWLGGTLAMATKACFAIGIGLRLRDRYPQGRLRALASASCCVLGALALCGLLFP